MNDFHVEVIEREYLSEHGSAPRGRGNWAFCLVNPIREDYLDYVLWVNGRYADALSVAKKIVAGKLPAVSGDVQAGKESLRVSVKPAAAALLESGGHASVLYVCS